MSIGAVVAGVVSAVVASFLAWLVWTQIVPHVSQRLNQDGDISGKWIGSADVQSTGLSYTYRVELKPRVTYWRGTATITRQASPPASPGGRGYEHSFSVLARRRGSYVLMWLIGDDESSASVASGLFFLDDRGRMLRGRWAFRRESGTNIGDEEIVLRRP